jgi:chorismate mutase
MSKNLPQLRIEAHSKWVPQNGRPLIIAGPCSAESEEQVLQTARELKKIPGVSVFRAGVWKPRTRPNAFEGIGVPALQWLKKVQKETGLLTAVEVANTNHVYEALKFGVDVLWVGARTTANPFSVQEVADALRGVDVPVWVKNPVNPDLQLWIGALERLNNAGITRLGAIHRGFSTYDKTPYRNAPKWDIPIELKRQIPDIPLICDPSHIAGTREYIRDLSQKALDLAMNGLMIETHINPAKALSDAAQQLRPAELQDLLNHLKFRKAGGDRPGAENLLTALRHEIDMADHQLMEIIGRRHEIVTQIARYKIDHNMTILQVNRWKDLLEDRLEQARQFGVDEEFVTEIFQLIHQASIKLQSKLMNQNGVV